MGFARTSLNVKGQERSPGSDAKPSSKGGQVLGVGMGNESCDTLVMMGVGDKGYTHDTLIEFFSQMEGFEALRYTSGGKGGGSCFVKFNSGELAAAAKEVSIQAHVDVQIARSSLNPQQATYVAA